MPLHADSNDYVRGINKGAEMVRPKWQPIETAPKMTAILLWAHRYCVGHFNTRNDKWWIYTDGTGTMEEIIINSHNKPTHWMPLPEPPQQGQEQSNG